MHAPMAPTPLAFSVAASRAERLPGRFPVLFALWLLPWLQACCQLARPGVMVYATAYCGAVGVRRTAAGGWDLLSPSGQFGVEYLSM